MLQHSIKEFVVVLSNNLSAHFMYKTAQRSSVVHRSCRCFHDDIMAGIIMLVNGSSLMHYNLEKEMTPPPLCSAYRDVGWEYNYSI